MQDMVLALMLLVCLVTDLKKRKIYNLVLVSGLFFGIFYNLVTGGGQGLLQSSLGLSAGLGILIIPFALGGMGAGDVKLLAVIGSIKGPVYVFYTAVGMGLAGGIIALSILAYKKQLINTMANFFRGVWVMLISGFKVIEFNLNHEEIIFPYAVAIVAGAMGAFWWTR
jgi:prepilin peptidase CpaA